MCKLFLASLSTILHGIMKFISFITISICSFFFLISSLTCSFISPTSWWSFSPIRSSSELILSSIILRLSRISSFKAIMISRMSLREIPNSSSSWSASLPFAFFFGSLFGVPVAGLLGYVHFSLDAFGGVSRRHVVHLINFVIPLIWIENEPWKRDSNAMTTPQGLQGGSHVA